MKSFDLFKRKIRLPKRKQDDYLFGLSRIENSLLAFVVLALVIVAVMSSLKLPVRQNSENLATSTQPINSDSYQNNALTVYTNIEDQASLSDLRAKLVKLGYRVNLTSRSNIDADIIYFPQDDQAGAELISQTLARSFELRESVSATATGFVIYLKQ